MIPVSILYDDYIDQPKMTEHSRLTSGEWGGGAKVGEGNGGRGFLARPLRPEQFAGVGVGGGGGMK